jgi:hypothetical protein
MMTPTEKQEFDKRQEEARKQVLYKGRTAEQAGYWPPGPEA